MDDDLHCLPGKSASEERVVLKKISDVPLLDLKAQYQAIRAELDEAVARVMESQQFILGPEVKALEEEIAQYCQCQRAVGVSSGSDALLMALMALGIGPGDEVITTPYTFFATAGAIHRLGARPAFVDINPETYNLDPAGLAKALSPRSRAVIPVHLFGQCADMAPILDFAGQHGLAVIEDAAQAIGAEDHDRRAGSMGLMGCFSFFPSKNLGGIGDGGMITTNDAPLAEKLEVLRNHGSQPKYYHQVVGGNFRLDALNAAVLRVKLKRLDSWTAKRQTNAQTYDRLFREFNLAGKVKTPAVKASRHVFNQYVIRATRRDQLLDALKAARIGFEIYYPVPLHLQECFAYLGHGENAFPESEAAARETLALPIYPELGEARQRRVVQALAGLFSRRSGKPSNRGVDMK